MNDDNRPSKPRDEDREQLQADLTRLVGTGRLQFAEFDELMDIIWSTDDKTVLDRIRARYLTYQGHPQQPPQPPAQYQQPGYPQQYPHPGPPQQPGYPPHQDHPQQPGQPQPPAPFGRPRPMAQPGAQHFPQPMAPAHQPVTSNLGSITRRGEWTVPEHSTFKLNGATLHLDLRQAHAAAPVVTFDITVTMGTVQVIVPPGVHVENHMKESWSSSDIQVTAPAPGAPRVILTGRARGSEIKVETKQLTERGTIWRKLFGEGR